MLTLWWLVCLFFLPWLGHSLQNFYKLGLQLPSGVLEILHKGSKNIKRVILLYGKEGLYFRLHSSRHTEIFACSPFPSTRNDPVSIVFLGSTLSIEYLNSSTIDWQTRHFSVDESKSFDFPELDLLFFFGVSPPWMVAVTVKHITMVSTSLIILGFSLRVFFCLNLKWHLRFSFKLFAYKRQLTCGAATRGIVFPLIG